jgi:hypothetical protein
MDLIQTVQELREAFSAARDGVAKGHPTWDVIRDARLTGFSKAINVLNSTQLGLVHIRFHLTDRGWWNTISRTPISEADLTIYVAEFDMFVKLGFLQFLFASLESSLRAFLRAIDPSACTGGTAEFKSVYDCLFTRLGLTRYTPLLDLLRLIRNTVHNNGVYFHRSGEAETVTHSGTAYTFSVGKRVSFVTWPFLFGLAPEVRHLLLDTVESAAICAPSFIQDPFAPERERPQA